MDTTQEFFAADTDQKEPAKDKRTTDVSARLLRERKLFLFGGVNDDSAKLLITQMLFLEMEDSDKDIRLYINSYGGSVSAGMAIFDTMNYIKPDVSTYAVGMAGSMGAFLLAAGTKGRRFAFPNSTVMIHQPSGGFHGQVSDIERHADYIISLKRRFISNMAQFTGRSFEEVELAHDRDNFMTAQEAHQYGIVDRIITKDTIENPP